jgi:hypothetical protein
MRFAIKNGGTEQRLDASALPEGEWTHVAVTLGASGVRMYLNGELVDESTDVTIRPIDFKPILNYIGRAQTTVPFLNGLVDDFRIYNYELSPEEIAKLVSDINTDVPYVKVGETKLTVYPVPANDILNFNYDTQINRSKEVLRLYNVYGRLILQEDLQSKQKGEINVSNLPVGMYILEITNGEKSLTKKIIINH